MEPVPEDVTRISDSSRPGQEQLVLVSGSENLARSVGSLLDLQYTDRFYVRVHVFRCGD